MNKSERDHRSLVRILKEAVESSKQTQQEIAISAGVSQSQISRILSGRTKRTSRAIMRLCKKLKIDVQAEGRKKMINDRLTKALLEIWDGSREHELAIIRMLEAMGPVMRS